MHDFQSRKMLHRFLRENLDKRFVVGPVLGADGTTPSTGRQGKTGEAAVVQVHGKYYEAASRGTLFSAADAGAGVAVTATITTTATFTLHNPLNSQKRIAIKKLSVAYFSGTLGAGAFYHGHLPPGNTLPSSGTALTARNMDIGNQSGVAAVGVATTAATVVAGLVLYPFASLFPVLATSAVSGPVQCTEDVDGAIVLEPGAQYQLLGVFGAAGTTPKVDIGCLWEEIGIVASNG